MDDVRTHVIQETLVVRDDEESFLPALKVAGRRRRKERNDLLVTYSHTCTDRTGLTDMHYMKYFVLVEPDDGVQVQVVCGFVQHQQRGFHEQSSVCADGDSESGEQVQVRPDPRRDVCLAAAAYLARETLILQPPENLLVGLFCISGVKDKPARILLALASAAAAPMALSSS